MSDWREQYGRTIRMISHLHWASIWEESAFDNSYAFAQACYHLVDWLENDPSQPIRREEADRHVASSPILALCRDICNGTKQGVSEAKNVQMETRIEVLGAYRERFRGSEWKEEVVRNSEILVHLEGALYTGISLRCPVHRRVEPATN